MSVSPLRVDRTHHTEEVRLREDLAAAFRLAADLDWHEAVANHFSVAVPGPGNRFLMNPRWRHFGRIKASDLLLLDADDETTMQRPDAPDPSAWCIHGRIHALLPHARCVLHLHPPYGTAIAALANPTIVPIDQNTARYYNRVVIDLNYGGIADFTQEGNRIATALGDKRRIMLGNHGVLVVADTVAEAFDDMYYLERSCRTLALAYATGCPLNTMPHDLAERTARAWEGYADAAHVHFAELRALLDAKDPSYRD